MVEGIHHIKTQNEASFAAWLFQVTRMTVADYYRKREKLTLTRFRGVSKQKSWVKGTQKMCVKKNL